MGNTLESIPAGSESSDENKPMLAIKINRVSNIKADFESKPMLEIHAYYGDNPFDLLHHTTAFSDHINGDSIIFGEELMCDISVAMNKKMLFIDFELLTKDAIELGKCRTKNLLQLEPQEEAKIHLPLQGRAKGSTLEISALLKQDAQLSF
jgi:hypothetical protein